MKNSKPALHSRPITVLLMVCGRTPAGDPAYFPQAEYHGRTVYFCTDFCLQAFQADPERFYTAHRLWRGRSGLGTKASPGRKDR